MLLDQFAKEPLKSLQYAERYVNDGSPSGFAKTTSEATSPIGTSSSFHLFAATAPAKLFSSLGYIPTWPGEELQQEWMLIHPDMVSAKELLYPQIRIQPMEKLQVVPTSSGRTVQFVSRKSSDYVKLHYKGILGRFERDLPLRKAFIGPEVSQIIETGFREGIIGNEFAIMPETGARVLRVPNQGCEWGMVWRSSQAIGPTTTKIQYIIPLFSFFSHDRFAPKDPLLLSQLISLSNQPPIDFILQTLLSPILNAFFALISRLGMLPEWNAQNLLVGIGEKSDTVAIIARDLGETDRDLQILRARGLRTDFTTSPFRCIDEKREDYYAIHSLKFDFKLGEYVITPLLSTTAQLYNIEINKLQEAVKDLVAPHLQDLPNDFFPPGNIWYQYKNVMFDELYYYPCKEPKYRPSG